jgi:antitoxin component YwqK of YwqJK toxin-antitoxin module
MKKQKNKFILFVVLIIPGIMLCFMQSCKSDWNQKQIITENGNVLIKTFDSTGKLTEVKTYREGDSLHYCILKYDKLGIVYDSIPYVGRQRHGERKTLDAKDNIVYTNYINGEENGAVRAYYNNAVMEYIGRFRGNGHQVGEWQF